MDEVGGFVYESGYLCDEPGFRTFLFSGGWARLGAVLGLGVS